MANRYSKRKRPADLLYSIFTNPLIGPRKQCDSLAIASKRELGIVFSAFHMRDVISLFASSKLVVFAELDKAMSAVGIPVSVEF